MAVQEQVLVVEQHLLVVLMVRSHTLVKILLRPHPVEFSEALTLLLVVLVLQLMVVRLVEMECLVVAVVGLDKVPLTVDAAVMVL
jgi:hypothetical protein